MKISALVKKYNERMKKKIGIENVTDVDSRILFMPMHVECNFCGNKNAAIVCLRKYRTINSNLGEDGDL